MNPKYMVDRAGVSFALYKGILDHAHGEGLRSIDTEIVQLPNEDNGYCTICRAVVIMEGADGKERRFTGIGDAHKGNVAPAMVGHVIRLAETRAKARALRDAINVAECSVEELGEGDNQAVRRRAAPRPTGRTAVPPTNIGSERCACGAPPGSPHSTRCTADAAPAVKPIATQEDPVAHAERIGLKQRIKEELAARGFELAEVLYPALHRSEFNVEDFKLLPVGDLRRVLEYIVGEEESEAADARDPLRGSDGTCRICKATAHSQHTERCKTARDPERTVHCPFCGEAPGVPHKARCITVNIAENGKAA